MAPYKINRNQKPLTDEQIERHKSFSALLKTQQELHQYKTMRKPLYKNIKVLSIAVILFTLVLVMVMEYADKEETKTPVNDSIPVKHEQRTPLTPQADTLPQERIITPQDSATEVMGKKTSNTSIPVDLQIHYTVYQVNAETGTVLYPGNGSRIIIPANAFKDAQGNIIKGVVNIQYREFRNSFDFFRANIPMHWKDGQCLVSNGMFEIKGSQNDKNIQLAKGITVDLLTVKQQEQYQLYYFNEGKNEWIEKGKENKREIFYTQTTPTQRYEKAAVQPPPVYLHPMSVFDKLSWELVSVSSSSLFNSLLSTPCYDISITSLQGDLFTLKITSGVEPNIHTNTVTATLYPIYTDPAQHKAWINNLYNTYLSAYKNQQDALEKNKKEREAYLNSPEYKKYQEWIASPEYKKMELNTMVYSRFTINQFGTWNCDRPEKLPSGASLQASFTDENHKAISPSSIYLVDYKLNSIFTYYSSAFDKFSFNPAHDNVAWCVLDQDHIGIIRKEDFQFAPKSGKHTFVMKSIDISGMREDEFNKLFSLPAHVTATQQIQAQSAVNAPDRTIVISANNNGSFSDFK